MVLSIEWMAGFPVSFRRCLTRCGGAVPLLFAGLAPAAAAPAPAASAAASASARALPRRPWIHTTLRGNYARLRSCALGRAGKDARRSAARGPSAALAGSGRGRPVQLLLPATFVLPAAAARAAGRCWALRRRVEPRGGTRSRRRRGASGDGSPGALRGQARVVAGT